MTDQTDRLEDILPQLLKQRSDAESAVQTAEEQLQEAQRLLRSLNLQLASALRKAGVLGSDGGDSGADAASNRYCLVWKMRDEQRAADGDPDPLSPVEVAGQPVGFANRQTKLAPNDDYQTAIGENIDCVALIDSTTNETVDTEITWGKPRGKAS